MSINDFVEMADEDDAVLTTGVDVEFVKKLHSTSTPVWTGLNAQVASTWYMHQ